MSPKHASSMPATSPSFSTLSEIMDIELAAQLLMTFSDPPLVPGSFDTITSPPESPQSQVILNLTYTPPLPAPPSISSTTIIEC